MAASRTVTLQLAALPPAGAVIRAVPGAFAVTCPVEETVATALLEEAQVTVLLVALSGLTEASR